MAYKGIIFDFDGVIVDSERRWLEIEGKYLKKKMPSWEDKNYAQLIGRSLKDAHGILREQGLPLTYQEYANDYDVMALQIYGHLAVNEGVELLFKELSSNNVKIAIASSSKRSWIDLSLKRNMIEQYFQSISSVHDEAIENGKPSPDIFLAAARSVAEPTSALMAIEDSTNGVKAAKAAGLFCVGFKSHDSFNQDLSSADMVINDFSSKNRRLLLGLFR